MTLVVFSAGKIVPQQVDLVSMVCSHCEFFWGRTYDMVNIE